MVSAASGVCITTTVSITFGRIFLKPFKQLQYFSIVLCEFSKGVLKDVNIHLRSFLKFAMEVRTKNPKRVLLREGSLAKRVLSPGYKLV